MKEGFQADRLSDHRYMANLFRLYLHALAANLLTLLRREVANPPRRFRTDQDCPCDGTACSRKENGTAKKKIPILTARTRGSDGRGIGVRRY